MVFANAASTDAASSLAKYALLLKAASTDASSRLSYPILATILNYIRSHLTTLGNGEARTPAMITADRNELENRMAADLINLIRP